MIKESLSGFHPFDSQCHTIVLFITCFLVESFVNEFAQAMAKHHLHCSSVLIWRLLSISSFLLSIMICLWRKSFDLNNFLLYYSILVICRSDGFQELNFNNVRGAYSYWNIPMDFVLHCEVAADNQGNLHAWKFGDLILKTTKVCWSEGMMESHQNSLHVEIRKTICNFERFVGWFLYMLHWMELKVHN